MRLNIVPVEELMDQHLVAEYREIKMLPKMLDGRLPVDPIPEEPKQCKDNKALRIFK